MSYFSCLEPKSGNHADFWFSVGGFDYRFNSEKWL